MGSGIQMRARTSVVIEVGTLAHRVLRRERRGRIAAVFDRSLYAVFDDNWICIGSQAIGSGPLHVLCDGIVFDRFSPGQDIAVTDTALVAGDPAQSKKLVDDYTSRFPSGAFAQEAEVLRIEALIKEGNEDAAAPLGLRFLTEHPASPHAIRVRTLLGGAP